MYMGAAAGAFEKAGNKNFVLSENCSADRAYTIPFAAKAVDAATDVHEAVFAAVQRRKGRGTYQFPVVKFGGTYRTNLRFTGNSFIAGLEDPAAAETASRNGYPSNTEKEGIAEPEQNDSQNHKNHNPKNFFHYPALAAPLSLIILFLWQYYILSVLRLGIWEI